MHLPIVTIKYVFILFIILLEHHIIAKKNLVTSTEMVSVNFLTKKC